MNKIIQLNKKILKKISEVFYQCLQSIQTSDNSVKKFTVQVLPEKISSNLIQYKLNKGPNLLNPN